MEKACSGFGHRTVFGNIELAVQACVIQAIEMGCTVFYTGAMGEFDSVFISAVRAAKRRYPDALYDDVLVPEKLVGLHYKRAIPARNRWMVDRSDMVIGYVIRQTGGAYAAVQYAQTQGKVVCPVIASDQ